MNAKIISCGRKYYLYDNNPNGDKYINTIIIKQNRKNLHGCNALKIENNGNHIK